MNLRHPLEIPFLYRLSQQVLAPGLEKNVLAEIKTWANGSSRPRRDLDIGCGPNSLLRKLNLEPVGLDPNHAYLIRFSTSAGVGVAGSSAALPFQNNSYDAVWNFGLLHHLSRETAVQSIREMIRVAKPGGRVIVFDGILPEKKWLNFLPRLIRHFDRGRFMRDQSAFESLLVHRSDWQIKRFRYSYTGLEGVLCVYQKPKT